MTMPLTLGKGLINSFDAAIIRPESPISIYSDPILLAKIPLTVQASKNLISLIATISWRKPTPFDTTVALRFNIYRNNITDENLIYTTVDSEANIAAFNGQTTTFIYVDKANNFMNCSINNKPVSYFLTVELEQSL
ncbi:hypothetical protein [Clostridium brassicae]|uniref:Uncharacterized protein n=1 Tax=Clostridium brassicae TaxID=2999072 RepID=A0ABT4DD77_9CLOT|nr:hypothetical protein [Clostridium brassicae]MCY6959166.1 hypothetical protein [Clostridium brassicae]